MRFGTRELMFLLVLVALPVAAWFFVFAPRAAQVAEVEAEVQQKQAKLQQLEVATAAISNLGDEIDKLTQAIALFEQKLPAEQEVQVILREVSVLASRHKLATKSVRTDKPVTAASYIELPIKMEIVGDFDSFYSFLLDLQKLERITRMPNMKLKKVKDEEGVMEAQVTLSIFFEGPQTTTKSASGNAQAPGEPDMTQFQTNPSNDPSRQDLPESMSLMGIGRADALTEAEQLELASEASGNSISQGTVLLIIIAIVAGGVLYGMRQLQGDISSGVDAKAVAKIDEALSKFAKPGAVASDDPLAPAAVQALFRDTDGIIAMLSSDFGRQQVPVEYVKKNPFALKLADKPVAMVASTGNPSAALKKLEQEINKYKLQTVMNGRVPIAVINGEMYRQGQQLGSFTIAEINSETLSVTLAGGGQQFNLAMEQQ